MTVLTDENSRGVFLPDPLVDAALRRPITRHLVVFGAGEAHGHRYSRPTGQASTLVEVCVSGTGWVRVDGRTHRVNAGTAFVIPAGVPHSYASADPPWTTWWCALQGSDVDEFLLSMRATIVDPVVPVRNAERVAALIQEIATGYEHESSGPRALQVAGLAWRLLTQIAADRVRPPRHDPLRAAMEYLGEHSHEDVDVQTVADQVGLSASRLSTLFRDRTGGGVHAHLIGLRMSHARRLLDTTTMRVATIAREVGYADPHYFSRHFREVNGMTPSEYRRRPTVEDSAPSVDFSRGF